MEVKKDILCLKVISMIVLHVHHSYRMLRSDNERSKDCSVNNCLCTSRFCKKMN